VALSSRAPSARDNLDIGERVDGRCGIARPLRLQGRGAIHHVIGRGNERKALFRDDRDRDEYLDRLDRYRTRFDFALYAYCLMTNHVHLAIEEGDVRLSRIMHGLQFSYTQWFNRRHRRVGHLYQGIPVAEFARLFRREHSGLLHGVLSLERRIENDRATREKVASIDRVICNLAGLQA
jgi:REP element-mobilizing transposase RayT